MEYILYVLISIAVHSDGSLNFYEPATYVTEEECKYNRARILSFTKPDSIIAYDAVCSKVVLISKGV